MHHRAARILAHKKGRPEGRPVLALVYEWTCFSPASVVSGPRQASVVASDDFPSSEAVPQVFPYMNGLTVGVVIIVRFLPPSRSTIAPVSGRRSSGREADNER